MINTTGPLPDRILLDSTYFWEQLSPENLQFELSKQDCESVIESLIAKFVSVNDFDVMDYHVEVPDFNRMRDKSIVQSAYKHQNLMRAVERIEQHLFTVLTEHGIFEEDQQFSYMFDRLLGNTIVLFKLPH